MDKQQRSARPETTDERETMMPSGRSAWSYGDGRFTSMGTGAAQLGHTPPSTKRPLPEKGWPVTEPCKPIYVPFRYVSSGAFRDASSLSVHAPALLDRSMERVMDSASLGSLRAIPSPALFTP